MNDRTLLFELLKTVSVSGQELNTQKFLINKMKDIDDEIITHHNYNVTHVINPNSDFKVMLCGHIDEVGLYVDKILDNGQICVNKVGFVKPYMYMGQHVRIMQEDGTYVPGVVGYLPKMNDLDVLDLRIDIGAVSKIDAEKYVHIGNPIVQDYDYQMLANDRLSGRALDDKLSVYIMMEVLNKLKQRHCTNGVYAATTVGEETANRGVRAAVNQVKPDCAIILDVIYAPDLPYYEPQRGELKLGKGPAIAVGSLMNDLICKQLKECAAKLKIDVQYIYDANTTFTDLDYLYYENGGIPCCLISIPLRYMHSSIEVCDLKDVDDIIELVTEFISSIDKNFNFNPFN